MRKNKIQKRRIKYQFILILIIMLGIFGFTKNSLAAPSINNFSGSISNGGQIIINSANNDFGENGPKIAIFDDFEKGIDGGFILSGSNSAQFGEWSLVQSGGDGTRYPVYDSEYSISGSLAFKGDNDGTSRSRAFFDFPEGVQTVLMSFWMYIPSESNWPLTPTSPDPQEPWKVTALMHDGPVSGGPYIIPLQIFSNMENPAAPRELNIASRFYEDNDQDGIYEKNTDEQSGDMRAYSGWMAQKGKWKRIWIYLDASGDPLGGIAKIWTTEDAGINIALNVNDFKMIGQNNILPTDDSSYHMGCLNYNGWRIENAYPRFDDFYVAYGSGAQARVEIGNNSNYNNCTNLSIITPTLWSSNFITATVRQGSFQNGSTAYLFVIDENGEASEGYPITIGGESGITTPGVPNGLSVS